MQNSKTVYSWNQSISGQERQTGIIQPVLAVDDTVDPATGTANGPFAGNVYNAYIGDTPPPQDPPSNYTRTTVDLVTSTDQGATFNFSAPIVLNAGGNFSATTPIQQNDSPRIAISQGRADGTGPSAGQVTVVWDDSGSNSNLTPPLSILKSRRVTGGGTSVTGGEVVIARTLVRGQVGGGGQTPSAASPVDGIGPAPTIASDNTLGTFSQFQGRLYVASPLNMDLNP